MSGPNNPDFSLESKKRIAQTVRAVLGAPGKYGSVARPERLVGDAFQLAYTKLSADWSSNTANIVFGHSCSDASGAGTTSNTANVALYFPRSARPDFCDLRTNNVLGYVAFSGTVLASVFGATGGAATNALAGIAMPTNPPRSYAQYVLLNQTGGSAGDSSTACTFTYDVTDPESLAVLVTAAPVLAPRLLNVTMTAATNGIGQYVGTGTSRAFMLLQAFEKMAQVNCS